MLKKSQLKRGNSSLKKSPLKKSQSSIGGRSKPLKKTYLKKSREKTKEELFAEQLLKDKRTAFFSQCNDILTNRSEISGKRIPYENRATRHHCYLKSSYPEIEFSFRGILTCTFEEHQELHKDLDCYPIAAERRIWMKEHWQELIEESLKWENDFMEHYKK